MSNRGQSNTSKKSAQMFDNDKIERFGGEPEPSKNNLLTVSMAKSSPKREAIPQKQDEDEYFDDFEDVDLDKTKIVEKPKVDNSLGISDDLNFDPLSLMNSNIPNDKKESEIKEEKKKEQVLPSPSKPEVSTVNIEVPSIYSINDIAKF